MSTQHFQLTYRYNIRPRDNEIVKSNSVKSILLRVKQELSHRLNLWDNELNDRKYPELISFRPWKNIKLEKNEHLLLVIPQDNLKQHRIQLRRAPNQDRTLK